MVSKTELGGRTKKDPRRHKELVSDKLNFGNGIPDDCVLVLFETGNGNGRDRHLIATGRTTKTSADFKYCLGILPIYNSKT